MKNQNKLEILSIYPNDSDSQEIYPLYDIELARIFDTEDFLQQTLYTITRQCYGYKNLTRMWPKLSQQQLTKGKYENYYQKIINNRISRFPQLNLQGIQQIEGKRYKIVLYSELMFKLHPQKMVCCICEKEILLSIVEEHSQLCLKKHMLNKDIYTLQDKIQELSEEINNKEIELITKINLYTKQRMSEKNLSHQNSPVMSRSKQQITLSKFAQQSDQRQRGIQRAKTINISEDNSISEFPTFHQRKPGRNFTRLESSMSMSPDSQKQIKCAISLLKVTQQYCQKILKQDNSFGLDIDAKFQSLIKLGLPEINHLNDVSELMKRSLSLITQRLELNKQVNKIEAAQLQLQCGSIEKLKKIFQKGLSNSYKQAGTSLNSRNKKGVNTGGKVRIMDLVKPNKSKFNQRQFKEDQEECQYQNQQTPIQEQKIDSLEFITFSPSEENANQNTKKQQQLNIHIYSQQEDDDSDDVQQNLFIRGYYSDSGITLRIPQSTQKIMTVGLKDFEFQEVLGVGAYGAVWKVRKLKTNDVYAMKVIDTQQQSSQNFFETLKAESTIFSVLEGDFVAKAYYSFSHSDCLFYVLEYVKGGDFDKILRKYGALDEPIAKFYIGELLLAIEALHKKQIIHRDLKPQNILVDGKGHLKLTDFGLSEIGMKLYMKQSEPSQALKLQQQLDNNIKDLVSSEPKSPRFDHCISIKASNHNKHRVVGTPDYIAPEVIRGESISNESLDQWSLGVITYEFLVGIPPFNDDTPEKIFENILQRNICWPEIGDGENQLSLNAKDFIERLLDPNYKTRMTVEEAKKHPFFKDINFDTLRKQHAPIIPDNAPDDQPLLLIKKQREKEKLTKLLRDTSSENSTISKLGVDNLLRLDLLVEMNQQKAHQLRKKYH
ncbi:unnamed protein product [Paramecium primaurelia]|uniref:non-specific serine/threonine protein kinase n=1 Tax=Paramecium primaurelia TaxID=5886 RepID=A0A8S1N1T8_PARPR|nr:unnamed protein product [Paramecium primaurelia]